MISMDPGIGSGRDGPARGGPRFLKRCTYIVSTKGSISWRKKSIEEDVYAGSALVLEESVD